MDLFKEGIIAPDPAYNYIRDGNHPMKISGRDLCNRLWLVYEPYAAPHFLEQFPIDFDARFWEMDLTCTFIEGGYSVSCPKPGPDICINEGNRRIWIEAIAPNSGKGPDEVPELVTGIVQTVPDEQIILRLTAAIAEKHNKYLSYLRNGIILENEPYIIAINGCQIRSSRSDFEPPRIVRAVFPIGHEFTTFDQDTGKTVGGGFEFKPAIKKANRTDIPIDIFLNPSFEGGSAVLYSNSDCCNRPIITGDEYVLVHNPLAKNPLGEGVIKYGRECIPERYSGTEYRLRWNEHRALSQRSPDKVKRHPGSP